MKNILFLSICLLFGTTSQAQTTVFFDDFENGLGFWTIQVEDTFTVNAAIDPAFNAGWIALTDPNDSTDTVAGATSYFTTPGKASRWMISPGISVGAFGNYLSWKARSHDPSYPDGYKILVSTTDNNVSSFTDTVGSILQEFEDWTTRTVNLSDSGYINQTIYLAIVIDSYDMFKLYFNEVKVVSEDPVGIAEQATVNFGLFPNPATTTINVQSENDVKSVRIVDAMGNHVRTISGNVQSVDISSLNAGMYWLELVTTENSVGRKRFVKK